VGAAALLDKEGEAMKLLGMMETIVRRGRVKGFIPWLITQRPGGAVNKDVLSQVDGLVAFKLTRSQDRDAIGDWVEGQADKGQWNIWRSLPTLERGQGVVWIRRAASLRPRPSRLKVTFDSAPARPSAASGEGASIPVALAPQRRATPAPAPVQRQAAPVREARQSEGEVPAGCAKPLAALAAVYPSGLTEPQWATSAGYKRSGGTWGTYKSRLRGAGLIEPREGRWFATEAGAAAAGDVELPPAPGPDLVRWWAAKLPGTSKMAEALIEAHPHGLTRDELAERIEMSASGGSFGTYLSRLAGPGLIDRSGGMVQLSADVMG
jgi:hypothetical protein